MERFENYDTFVREGWPVQVAGGHEERRNIKVTRTDGCDYGHQAVEAVRLPTSRDPSGGAVFLCPVHWRKEMQWRHERNRELSEEARFDIYQYPGKATTQDEVTLGAFKEAL